MLALYLLKALAYNYLLFDGTLIYTVIYRLIHDFLTKTS